MDVERRREEIDDHFRECLRLKGYHIDDMNPDGNCLFSSLSRAIFGPGINNQMDIRLLIFNHVQKHFNRFQPYVEILEIPGMTELEIFLAKAKAVHLIKKNGEYAGFVSLKAASEIYEKTIIVEQPLLEALRFSPDNADGGVIYLSYHNRNHYNALHKIRDGCCLEVVVNHTIQQNQVLIEQHFQEYLRLRNYQVEQVDEGNSPYNAISMALNGDDGEHQMDVRSDLQIFIYRHELDLRDKLREHVKTLDETLYSDEQVDNAVTKYIAQITVDGTRGDEFIVEVASKCFERVFFLEKPLEPPACYPKEKNISNTTVFLSLHNLNHFNLLRKISSGSSGTGTVKVDAKKGRPKKRKSRGKTSEIECDGPGDEPITRSDDKASKKPGEDDDFDLTSVIPFIPIENMTKEEELEGLYMLRNIHFKARSKVTVVFMVPVENLPHATLAEVIEDFKKRGEEIPFISVVVLYAKDGVSSMKRDADLPEVFTLYSASFSVPLDKAFYDRTTWLSNLIIVPLLFTMNKRRWNGIKIHALARYTPQALAVRLLTNGWTHIREKIKALATEIDQNPESLFCMDCPADCKFKDVPCHWNMKEFLRMKYLDATLCLFMESYDLFSSYGDGAHLVMLEILQLYWGTSTDRLRTIFDFLDSNYGDSNTDYFCSYMVLHIDGPMMNVFGDDSYYDMLQDESVQKSIYAGSTTNNVFRKCHATDETGSLNSVLTNTSRLFLLRCRRFKKECEAREDEARVIEVLSYYLKIKRDKKLKRKFLLLNKRAEQSKLIPTPKNISQDMIDFCHSGIPVFSSRPTQKIKFPRGPFRGNYKVIRELTLMRGAYMQRQFTDDEVQEMYHEIKMRQP